MTRARNLADFNAAGVLTSTSNLNAQKLTGNLPALNASALTSLTPANLDSTGTIPSALLAGVGGGAMTLIRSGSATAGDASATLTGVFDSTYSIYKIFLYDWNSSVDSAPYLRWVTGTNTEQSANNSYQYAGVGFNTSGQNSAWSGSDNQFQIAGETIRHDSDEHFAWEGTLYNPAGTTLKKRLVFSGGGRRTSNYGFSANGTGEWNDLTAITGFKIFPSGGTFDSVSWRVYGIEG